MKLLRTDFPLLKTHQLCYLDTASTSQKPQIVIDAMIDFYQNHNANVGRSVYGLAEEATRLYEDARAQVAHFIGADPCEIIFTSGCTESINYIAIAWAACHLRPGDEIVLTELEHHANILPWQRVAQKTGAVLKYIPVTSDGILDASSLDQIITPATRLVSFTLVSNAVGTHIDPASIIERARHVGAKIMVDAAQAVAHQPIDVRSLDCDFLAFSGHKMLGPTGIGVLYIKKDVQAEVEPYHVGGGMVAEVSFDTASYLTTVSRFEAGTPPIAQAIGLAAAVRYLKSIDMNALKIHETALSRRLIEGLLAMPQVRILGPIAQLTLDGHLVSFTVEGIHPHDLAAFLAQRGICMRAGTHCAQPLFKKLGIAQGAVRASFYGYNTVDEVDVLLEAVGDASRGF